MRVFVALILIAIIISASYAFPAPDEYKPGKALVRFTESMGTPQITQVDGIACVGVPQLDALAREFNIFKIDKLFPQEQKPTNPLVEDLSRWYQFYFPQEVSVQEVVEAYTGKPYIDIIEPDPIRKSFYIPNDPMFNSCWHIHTIKADSAWDVTHGSYLVDIAIVDSGIDTLHPDLSSQMWINYGEDVDHDSMITLWDWNNIDDDMNGKVDDFWGWDFVDIDNMPYDPVPVSQEGGHGTHCAGDASAATDNNYGVPGTGFSTRLMIVRTGAGGTIAYGIQGINYAGNNGADVISLSWGSSSYFEAEQSAITAAWQNGSVICAAAGNETATLIPPFQNYPSGCQHTIAVGASNSSDQLAYFSNYSATPFNGFCDVLAPGDGILGPVPGGGFQSWPGTSMACPIAAGICALIRAVEPNYTPAQVETVLCNTCDNIYPQNPSYSYGQLGFGRVSAFNAMLALAPYLSLDEFTLVDNGNEDGRADPGETCQVTVIIQNDQRAQFANNVTGLLSTDDPGVNMVTANGFFYSIAPGWSAWNSDPFVFSVNQTQPHFADFNLAITTDEGFSFNLNFQIELGRPEIILVDDDGGGIDQTYYLTSLNNIGVFTDVWTQATGEITSEELLKYSAVIWETGFATVTLNANEQSILQTYLNAGKNLLFSSTNAGTDIGTTSFYTNYLHAQFGENAISNFYINGVSSCPFSQGTTLFLIGGTGSGNNQSLESITALGGAQNAYNYSNSGPVCGIYYENTYKMIYLSFPLEAASGLGGTTSRQVVLDNIFDWFGVAAVAPIPINDIPQTFTLNHNYPNPFNAQTQIDFALPHNANITLKVFNFMGQEIAVLAEGEYEAGRHTVIFNAQDLSSGIYFVRLQAEGIALSQKMILLK